jgi:hypothetical protein
MHARTTSAAAVTALVAALALAGCSGGDDNATPSAAPEAPTTGTATSDDPGPEASGAGRIPDGAYSKAATEADADAAGLSEELREESLGSDGQMPTTIEFDGDRWTIYVTNDAGIAEVGDLGALEYDGQGRLVTTSESTGCPGCVWVADWSLEGETLELELTGEAVDPVEAFVINGVYSRDG